MHRLHTVLNSTIVVLLDNSHLKLQWAQAQQNWAAEDKTLPYLFLILSDVSEPEPIVALDSYPWLTEMEFIVVFTSNTSLMPFCNTVLYGKEWSVNVNIMSILTKALDLCQHDFMHCSATM